MQVPIRLAAALSPSRSIGTLFALGYATVVFIATPFLISPIGEHYDVGLTVSSLIGVLQLAGFAVGSWGSGRWLSPTRSVLISALGIAALANAASASLPPLVLLLAARALGGIGLGAISWFAWSNAFGRSASMSRVALVGPMIGVLATPAVALLIDRQGMRALFLVLAVLPSLPLLLSRTVASTAPAERTGRNPALPTAKIVLASLTLFSLGGSAVYQFGVTIAATELGLTASATAIGYTANAIVSIPSAGWRGRRTIPSPWMALTGVSAFLVATAFSTPFFFAGVIAWGFFYWMAIPGVFDVLAAASAHPAERAGDAQAMMAIGRLIGPFFGGLLLDGPGSLVLGITACTLMIAAALAVFTVRNHVSPEPTLQIADHSQSS